MKFSHMADMHLGGWKDPKIAFLAEKGFKKAVRVSIEEKVDFVLIAGDLFNTSMPGIDVLKLAVGGLKKLKNSGIPVYLIAGSHDFSPSGKTMLDVLEDAGMFVNVCKGEVVGDSLRLKFTVDPKTGAKITGMLGKKGMLDKKYYAHLLRDELEKEEGFKIFMFHTAITELKTKDLAKMESEPVSILPRGFDYYAGGHVHIVRSETEEGYKRLVYPGPLFPNNFGELEKVSGGFYIYDNGNLRRIRVQDKETYLLEVDASSKNPNQVQSEIVEGLAQVKDKIVLLRVKGKLENGKPSDINFKELVEIALDKGSYHILKTTRGLQSKEYDDVKIETGSAEEIETKLVSESGEDKELVERLMKALDTEKQEGETNQAYEKRVIGETEELFNTANTPQ